MASEQKQVPDSFKYYEDGKHRRYSLLFAVNGGAFAIAKVFAEKNAGAVLGNLSLRHLSVGMILFTIVMVVDIFMFGEKMRKFYLRTAFGWPGKIVLVLLGILICAGWFLVA
jgi:purine-cytosine permease-like protein